MSPRSGRPQERNPILQLLYPPSQVLVCDDDGDDGNGDDDGDDDDFDCFSTWKEPFLYRSACFQV